MTSPPAVSKQVAYNPQPGQPLYTGRDPGHPVGEWRGFVFELNSTPQLLAAIGLNGEPIPGYAQIGHRTTPQLLGRGLLGAITDSAIRNHRSSGRNH